MFWSDSLYLNYQPLWNSAGITSANRLHSNIASSIREHTHLNVCTPISGRTLRQQTILDSETSVSELDVQDCSTWFSPYLYPTSTNTTQRNMITDREEARLCEITSTTSWASPVPSRTPRRQFLSECCSLLWMKSKSPGIWLPFQIFRWHLFWCERELRRKLNYFY